MGVSIYYSARRQRALSQSEGEAIQWALTKFTVDSLILECKVSAVEFNGESFCVYPVDDDTEPDVVFEGATKLPSCSDTAAVVSAHYWCKLLSEVRNILNDADWHVHVDGYDVSWDDQRQAYTP